MDREEILNYVGETGYKTLSQLKEHFAGSNMEIMDASIEALVQKNRLRRVRVGVPINEPLYYVPE